MTQLSTLYRGPALRAWQSEAIAAWDKHHSGIIQAVPGAGKTILAVKMFTEKLEAEPNLKVIIVCPRLTLIQQWVDSILENSNITKSQIYEVSSHNEPRAHSRAQENLGNYKVFISTFRQIKQFLNEKEWKEHEWFLIVDEMHNTTENYKFPASPIKYRLGLSATPKKKGKDADFNLGGIVYTYPFSRALADKIILDPVIKIVFYSVNDKLFKKIQNEKGITADLVESAYDDFLNDAEMKNEENRLMGKKQKEVPLTEEEMYAPEDEEAEETAEAVDEEDLFTSKNTDFLGILRILEEQFHIGKPESLQSLVFVNRIKKADILNRLLAERFSEKVSHSYHSKSDNYNSRNAFSDLKQSFAQGEFNVLISVGTLGEGIDFPYASHGIIASPIYNPTSFVQKVGRLLRSYKDHRKAVIYYYVPSELITRLLTDEKIEPNYFKAVIKIADENKDLYFVDRKTLKEENGSLADLLIQGAAYERNDDIERIKMPHDLDAIMRFFRRVYPENLKDWKKYYMPQIIPKKQKKTISAVLKQKENAALEKKKEIDFSALREEISKNHSIMLHSSKTLIANLESITKLEKKFAGTTFNDFKNVKLFVKEALKQKITTKIKYGHELNNIACDKKSVLSLSEQEMLANIVAAELNEFCSKQKPLARLLSSLKTCSLTLESTKDLDSRNPKTISARILEMNKLAKSFFDLQSMFLDELEVSELAKNVKGGEKSFILTIGRDIFLTKHIARKYSYPEDLGLSRWREEKEIPVPVYVMSPTEKFAKLLMHTIAEKKKAHKNYFSMLENWSKLKKELCLTLKIPLQNDDEILKELEKHKHENEFSFEELFFVTEAIKGQKK